MSVAKLKASESEFAYMTRQRLMKLFKIPARVVDQWIATGQLTEMKVSVFGRGGQRVFYNAADAKKLVLAKPRMRKRRAPRRT